MTARLERQSDGYWRVTVNGTPIVQDESYGVAAAVEHAFNHPNETRSEALEIADQARKLWQH